MAAIGVGALGFVFFGPPEYTAEIAQSQFYRFYLRPLYDRFQAASGRIAVGRVLTEQQQLNVRFSWESAFQKAWAGQRLAGATLLSTGPGPVSVIQFDDDSRLSLGENTTLLLQPDGEPGSAPQVVTLNLVEGAIFVERPFAPRMKILIQLPSGKKESVFEKSGAFTARNIKVTGNPDALAEMGDKIPDFVGESQDEPSTLLKRAQKEYLDKVAARQTAIEIEAQYDEAHRTGEPAPGSAPVIAGVNTLRAPASVALVSRHAKRGPASVGANDTGKIRLQSFNDTSRLAAEDLVRGYIRSKDCRSALTVIEGMRRDYAGDISVGEWANLWKSNVRLGCRE